MNASKLKQNCFNGHVKLRKSDSIYDFAGYEIAGVTDAIESHSLCTKAVLQLPYLTQTAA
jgi:hypothetical protein